ncbi:MAG: hypothetical protein JRN52_15835 [Nitrososphaerota archaeon]|nr:hypothetical protein [Nitrososphaerota archaeon]
MLASSSPKKQQKEKEKRKESRYLKIVRSVFIVCKRQAVPLYSSKYSRKDFTIWQHIAILVMFQRIGKSYREFVDDWLSVSNALVEALGLNEKLPHYTTLEKFGFRVPSILLERVMGGFLFLVRCRKQDLGTDSTGMSCSHVSTYYALRIKRDIQASMRKQAQRRNRQK